MANPLPKMRRTVPISMGDGTPTQDFTKSWQDVVKRIEGAVLQSQGSAWTAATGTAARTALASYAGQTVSNPPTQAEMQALDDAVKAISQHLVALINDLKANGALA